MRPFKRPDYINKFRTLAEGIVAIPEQDRFIAAVERFATLKAGLNLQVAPERLGQSNAREHADPRRTL